MAFLFALGKVHSFPTYFLFYLYRTQQREEKCRVHAFFPRKEKIYILQPLFRLALPRHVHACVLGCIQCIPPTPAQVLFNCLVATVVGAQHRVDPCCCPVPGGLRPPWICPAWLQIYSCIYIYRCSLGKRSRSWLHSHLLDTLCWVFFSNDSNWGTPRFLSFAGIC